MFKIFRGDTMSLKWAINGVLDDIYFYAQGIPRLFIAWKHENKLSILDFFETNVKKHPNEVAFIFNDQKNNVERSRR